jgi:hypothetical protein
LAIENAGAVELVVFNAASLIAGTPVGISHIFPLQGWGIITTQAVSGATSAGIGYSNIARSSRPYVPIGYLAWETGSTVGSAGNWNAAPSRIQTFQPGAVPLPGQIIQQVYGSVGPQLRDQPPSSRQHDSAEWRGDQYMSLSIAPSSSANALVFDAAGHFSSGATRISSWHCSRERHLHLPMLWPPAPRHVRRPPS